MFTVALQGFRAIYMRIAGDHLDRRDNYEGEWMGGNEDDSRTYRLGGDGRRVIGVFGRANKQFDALGLIQSQ